MRIAIFGAGATGGFLGARLGAAGHEVALVARGRHLEALRRDGLQLQVGDSVSTLRLQASDQAGDLGRQDVVFVAVKATALAGAAPQLAPLIGPETLVVFLQNGMTWWYPVGLPQTHPPLPQLPLFDLAAPMLALMSPRQVVPGIVYSANEVVAPGVVRNNSPQSNTLDIAALDEAGRAAVENLRGALTAAAVAAPPVPDIRAALWLKLVVNASASPLAVVTGDPGAIGTDPAVHELFLRLAAECLAVASACGYAIADRLDTTRWTGRRSGHKPSMLQDYELGRAMEMAEIVLAPQAFARALGVATPSLDAVAAIATCLATARGLYRPAAAPAAPAAPA